MDAVTVFLPASTDIVVKGFTNAAYLQRITITPPSGTNVVFTGKGEGNNPIGSTHFTTPSGEGASVTVQISYSTDNGSSWRSPSVYSNSCTVQSFQLVVVVAEDTVDQDYNDAICYVSWSQNTQRR